VKKHQAKIICGRICLRTKQKYIAMLLRDLHLEDF